MVLELTIKSVGTDIYADFRVVYIYIYIPVFQDLERTRRSTSDVCLEASGRMFLINVYM